VGAAFRRPAQGGLKTALYEPSLITRHEAMSKLVSPIASRV
jgi:hypothetical protein